MKKKQLTATTLRILLIVSLGLVTAIGVGSFLFASSQLRNTAEEVSHAVVDADSTSTTVQTLQRLERELERQKDTIERTNQIVAESQSYQYQNQIIADLNKYADEANITITNMDFGAGEETPAASTPAPTPAPTAGSAGAEPGAEAAPQPAAPSVKSTSVSITLENPVGYNDILRFFRLIEQNLTKMQISRVGLSSDGTSSGVSSDALTIEVYIR